MPELQRCYCDMKSAPVASSNFLERIADPTSQFHPDYLSYRSGEITKHELIARLPHVAMLGDSACMGIYISWPWSTFWRAHTRRGRNWFIDAGSPRPGSPRRIRPVADIRSISKRLEEITPFVATEYAGIGAFVDCEGARLNFFRRILGTRNFSGQISKLLRAPRFPNLILISIGHNNVDWAWRCPPDELDAPERRLNHQSQQFRQNYARELRRLLGRARAEKHRVAVVVFGLINFESYFKGREIAERLRKSDRRLYPHLETTYKYLVSFHPAYRCNLIRLTAMMNEGLRAVVEELNRDVEDAENIQVRYSHALATADLSRAELLHPIDGWHASTEGHNVLAEAAFSDLGPSLEFLGIKRPRRGGFQSAPF
jgi:lysophospholipase L1-like esterase